LLPAFKVNWKLPASCWSRPAACCRRSRVRAVGHRTSFRSLS